MADYDQAVFISYAWGGEREEIVNQIDQTLQKRGVKIIRDKRDLGYKGSISEFMERIGRGNCVIVVISDKYLRSPNCMFELVEIAEGKQFHDRIFPIVLADADIYDPIKRIEYVRHWEIKRAELAEAMKTLDPANLQGIRDDMDLYDRIRDKISGLTSILKDMNTLTPDMHQDSDFGDLYDAIERRMGENPVPRGDVPNAPAREAPPPAGSTQQTSSSSGPSMARASQFTNTNTGGIQITGDVAGPIQFGAPIQFGGSTQNIGHQNIDSVGTIQNIYYGGSPEQIKSPDLNETIEIAYFEPETILIPEGLFWMGSAPADGIPSFEPPPFEVSLPVYRIGKYPVTNAQYEEFVRETRRSIAPEMGWEGQKVPAGAERLPVAGVTWYDALAYCQWLSQKTGRKYSLPNEAQWEKACRAGSNCVYPWGDEFDLARCNHGRSSLAPVDAYPPQNDYGCCDLVGNIRQWTCTLWGEKRIAPDPRYMYPWKDDERNDLNASRQVRRVVRGSTPKDDIRVLRCSTRTGQAPDDVGLPGARHGFRVVMTV